jgi:hypothetical protein
MLQLDAESLMNTGLLPTAADDLLARSQHARVDTTHRSPEDVAGSVEQALSLSPAMRPGSCEGAGSPC